MNPSAPDTVIRQAIWVSRCDRWSVYHRLQELSVPCDCSQDGCLWVDIQDWTTALQVRSVVRQFTASRSELLSWLQYCWQFTA